MLDKINPSNTELLEYIELRKNVFPLPLYVRLPDGKYKICHKLKENMSIKGIATQRGIFIEPQLYPSNIGKKLTVGGLYKIAAEWYPGTRPLTEGDIYGDTPSDSNILFDLMDYTSKMKKTVYMLSRHGMDLYPEIYHQSYNIAAIPKNAQPGDTSIRYFGLDDNKIVPIGQVYNLHLFLPAENIDMSKLCKHITF
ncbi:MAG: hypothetical protein J6Y53_05365 [Alphaproteobacteria bacterium]|nr:hypothetical protein [Alphaproteobacteria bacterium]